MVVAAYLGLTTLVGHMMRGKQATIRDFFLGGRSLPWPAVSGSIIATEISAISFVGIPAMFFAVSGNFTYLQWAIGSIIARIVVGYWLVPLYYKNEIYSPYDFMGQRLGAAVKQLVTLLFSLGAILGQSVRVLVTAIVLKVITGIDIPLCVVIIGLFAVAWTLMGGMRTVIWTDVMQFVLFAGGGILALVWLYGSLDGGWASIRDASKSAEVLVVDWKDTETKHSVYKVESESGEVESLIALEKDVHGTPTLTGRVEPRGDGFVVVVGDETIPAQVAAVDKLQAIDLRWRDPETKGFLIYTLWIGILAMPFQNFAAFGTDQLMAQRLFCCRDAREARLAIIWSSVSQVVVVLMLFVGAGLFAWYRQHAINTPDFSNFIGEPNTVFPTWITRTLPTGVSGLIIAGAFAAAISSLDSILAALSQTTLSAIYGEKRFTEEQDSKNMVWRSRIMVGFWAIVLVGVAIALRIPYDAGEKDIIGFAFRMVSYTYGPIIGILLLAILPVRASLPGILVGTAISMIVAAWAQPDMFKLFEALVGKDVSSRQLKFMAFPWFFPLNAAITFCCGWLFGLMLKDKDLSVEQR